MADLSKFEWFPLYFRRILASARYRAMKDYQQAWYLNLLFESAKSERPGYLKLNGRLWRLANAHTEQFFNRENVAVLACFKSREIDGETWMFNEKLLEVVKSAIGKIGSPQNDGSYPQEVDIEPSLVSLKLSLISYEELQKTIQRLFSFYVGVFGKDKRYKLTDLRAKKAGLRFMECLKDSKGDIAAAEVTCREAIENLAASQWHTENGHTDWIDQLFKNETVFQKRLAMGRPAPVTARAGECKVHPNSGATTTGACWGCVWPEQEKGAHA